MAWLKVRKFIRIYLLALASALLLVSLTLITFSETYTRVSERNRVLFNIRAESAKTDIEKRLNDYVQILKGAQALVNVSDTVTRQEWKNYVDILEVDENYPGIQGIGYSAFFPEKKLSSFEQKVRAEGFPEFELWPKDSRPVYSSILYLEPFNPRNRRAFGYDMFTDSIRRAAMEIARDTGKPALSGVVTLVQETARKPQRGFLLYLPIYEGGTVPASLEERRNQLKGFVHSPFRVKNLMKGILGEEYKDLDIHIFDAGKNKSAQQTLLYDKAEHYYNEETETIPELEKEFIITIAQHNWRLLVAARPGFGYETAFPWIILFGGLLISGLFFVIMFSMANIRRSTYLREVITDNATPALFIINTKDYCTFINPAAEILTGYSFEEIKEQPLHNLVHHSHPDGSFYEPSECPIMHALANRQSLINHEDVFFRRNGEKINVSINARPLYEKSLITSYLMEVRDISQEKEAEKALKEKNRNLQMLNKVGKNLSAELELNKLLQIVTDTCTDLVGADMGAFFYYTEKEGKEELRLHTLSGGRKEVINPLSLPWKPIILEHALETKKAILLDDITKYERFIPNKLSKEKPDGPVSFRSYLAVPVISREGSTIGGLLFGHQQAGVFNESNEETIKAIAAQAAIAIDNSQLFKAIKNKNRELQQINNELDNFVYTASHDLKAPVLNIEGLVYALTAAMEGNKPERIPMMIEMMKRSVLRFKETIQALTDIARTNKNLDEEVEVIDLEQLVDDIRFSIQDLIQQSGARIECQLECRYINFPKANMLSVLQNLLINAIKYRSEDRLPLIIFSSQLLDDKVVLRVEDNGMGIPENQLHKVFVMFKRYHTHIEGTGVGLYLVKRIIENFGGSVIVESTLGKGTVFTLSLPASVAEENLTAQ